MYTKASKVDKYDPVVSPAAAGELMISDGHLEVTAEQLAVNNLLGLCVLPAGCIPVDFTLIEDQLDSATSLVQDVGVLATSEAALTASTNLLTGTTIGRAGGYARATALPDALLTPSESDRIIAVQTTTGAVAEVKATGTITSSAINVTANDTVTINGKAYKFVAVPTDEGDVLMGAGGTDAEDSAATLDNLKLAINRTDPTTNDGVKYKIAAAHPTVAATTNTDTVQTLEALTAGVAGNALTLDKSAATLTVTGAGFLAGGVDATVLQAGTVRGILTYRAAEYGA